MIGKNLGEVRERGFFVEEQRECFTAALDAAIELRLRLQCRTGGEVRAPELEIADPRVEQLVGVLHRGNRLPRVPLLQRDVALEKLRVRLRLRLKFGAEALDQRRRTRDLFGLDVDSRSEEPNLHGLAVGVRFVRGSDSGSFPPSHGTLVFNVDGSFVYTPAKNFTGTDTFNYYALDVTPLSNANVAATATIAVTKK